MKAVRSHWHSGIDGVGEFRHGNGIAQQLLDVQEWLVVVLLLQAQFLYEVLDPLMIT